MSSSQLGAHAAKREKPSGSESESESESEYETCEQKRQGHEWSLLVGQNEVKVDFALFALVSRPPSSLQWTGNLTTTTRHHLGTLSNHPPLPPSYPRSSTSFNFPARSLALHRVMSVSKVPSANRALPSPDGELHGARRTRSSGTTFFASEKSTVASYDLCSYEARLLALRSTP